MAKEKPMWKSFVMRLDVRAELIKACFKGERELGQGSGKQPPRRALVPFAVTHVPTRVPWLHHGVLAIPQGGEQTAGGKGRGLESAVASTSHMLHSPRSA